MIVSLIIAIVGIPLGHAFKVTQPYYAVGRDGQVSLQCTFYTEKKIEEVRVSLYKGMYGEERICTALVNISNPYIATDGSVYCSGNVSKGRVDLTIFGLNGQDTDLFRCQVELLFPPPYISKFGNGTLVYIPETPNCPGEHTDARILETTEKVTQNPFQLPSTSIILLYVICITTTISLVLQVMKMILTRKKSNQISQKGNYNIFW